MESRRKLQIILFSLGGVIVLGYSFFVVLGFLLGPKIVLNSPSQLMFSTSTPLLELSGQALRTGALTINDNPTPTDLKGNFNEHIILGMGYNIVSVRAEDRYGRSSTKRIEVFVPPPVSPPPVSTSTASTTAEVMSTSSSTTLATSTEEHNQ